ncbi:substrate-binding domain-containing protein [Aliagarivorans taiwanensis]|uniref:substrate-binding domain-containing protein n=1 Tax=Aliagarivorans taiwanensis TaxID=561966 RepID=UPI0004788F9A|nr:substrate-binding domain-containing protein [Aliagarivorans taiwanensis]
MLNTPSAKPWLLTLLLFVSHSTLAFAERLVLVGSDTVYAYLQPHTWEIEQELGIDIVIRAGGEHVGMAKLDSHSQDVLAMLSRPLTEEELANGFLQHHFAEDDVAVVVSDINPVGQVSLRELQSLYQGQITWHALGHTVPVSWMSLGEQDSTSQFMHRYLGGEASLSNHHAVFAGVEQLVQQVSRVSGGVTWMAHAQVVFRRDENVKMLSVEGHKPGYQDYQLRRPLQLVSRQPLTPKQQQLVEWLRSHPLLEHHIQSHGDSAKGVTELHNADHHEAHGDHHH